QHDPRCALEGVNQVLLDVVLRLSALRFALRPEICPLHQKDIHPNWRLAHELLEDCVLTTVRLQIGRVEQPAAICLNEQRVSVEGTVVVEERRDGERTERKRLSVPKETYGVECDAGGKECAFFQDAARGLADVDSDAPLHLVDQSPMILMSMRDDETE